MKTIAAYLLMSHGRRHGPDVRELPGARKQMHVLRNFARKSDAELRIVAHDYARSIRNSDDLPNLFHLLQTCQLQFDKDGTKAHIILDDYSRLFRAALPDYRTLLWIDLMKYSDFLIDVRHAKPLKYLPDVIELLIKTGAMLPLRDAVAHKERSAQQRSAQTSNARTISSAVRQKSALRAARDLKHALETYRAENTSVTMKCFLETEEASALLNSQGKPWTYRTALRAIRDL